ncbi:MAG: ATP-dependent 6-phosphofructokinase [Planctomycetes bacterium]|nr:ATP-dependent 6-phosphofructokinase [Planctomycetota bacterium]
MGPQHWRKIVSNKEETKLYETPDFSAFITDLAHGDINQKLTAALVEVTNAVEETGKVGELSVKFVLKKEGKMAIVAVDLKKKVPEHPMHGTLFYIGDNDSMATAAKLNSLAQAQGYDLRVIGIPKTIDNDLMHTDVTFGFDTAVSTATDALDRIRTTAASHHRVMLVEMMGRNAGWLTLHSGAAAGADVILIPEIPYSLDVVCDACVRRSKKGRAFTIVAVAEGGAPVGGSVVVDHVVHESPDPIRLGGVSEVLCAQIAEQTKLESRATILGHVQRGGRPTARDRVLGTMFGQHAVAQLVSGELNRMVAMRDGSLTTVPLAEVADKQRLVPPDDPLLDACRAIGTCFGERT